MSSNCIGNVANLDISQRVDITCRKGDTFVLTVECTDSNGDAIDLSAYTFKMEVREDDTAASTVIADADTTITGSDQGVISINIANTVMAGVDGGLYVYDLQTVSGSAVHQTWLHGLFIVNEDITV